MRTAALAMTVAAAVGACAGIPAQAESEKVTVNFWHSMGGDNEKLLQSVVDAYNASQDKVEVVPEYQGNYYDSIAKYRQPSVQETVRTSFRTVPVRSRFWQRRMAYWKIWFLICRNPV